MQRTYTDTEIINALKRAEGVVAEAARLLGCSRALINKRAGANEHIRAYIVRRRGRKSGDKQYTDQDIVQAIRAANGLLSVAAEKLGCSRRTIELRAKESEEVREAISTAQERELDEAESQLGKAVRAGKAWAIIFILSTLGKKRGFTKQQIIDMNQHIIVDLPESFQWKEPEEE